jgi:hypothetical protein
LVLNVLFVLNRYIRVGQVGSKFLDNDEAFALFANTEELFLMHREFYREMRKVLNEWTCGLCISNVFEGKKKENDCEISFFTKLILSFGGKKRSAFVQNLFRQPNGRTCVCGTAQIRTENCGQRVERRKKKALCSFFLKQI